MIRKITVDSMVQQDIEISSFRADLNGGPLSSQLNQTIENSYPSNTLTWFNKTASR